MKILGAKYCESLQNQSLHLALCSQPESAGENFSWIKDNRKVALPIEAINFIKNLNIDEFQRIYSGTFRYTSIERFADLFFYICSKQEQEDEAKSLMESLLQDEHSDHIVLLMKYSGRLGLSAKDRMELISTTLDLSKEPLCLRNIIDYNEVAFALYRNGHDASAEALANSVLKFLKEESLANPSAKHFKDVISTISRLTMLLDSMQKSST